MTLEEPEALAAAAIENIKHNTTPCQINIKPYIKTFLPQFLLAYTPYLAFNKNYKACLKARKNIV